MRTDTRLAAILFQAAREGGTPVVLLTRKSQPLWLVMPFASGNAEWLQGDHLRRLHSYVRHPAPAHWTLPKTWLNDLCRRLVRRFGACYLVQSLRERQQCARACWNATGLICVCSCMGTHHGEGQPDGRWYEVSETCAVSWGDRQLHYKLLRARSRAFGSKEMIT
jgi:hypothetical protein